MLSFHLPLVDAVVRSRGKLSRGVCCAVCPETFRVARRQLQARSCTAFDGKWHRSPPAWASLRPCTGLRDCVGEVEPGEPL